ARAEYLLLADGFVARGVHDGDPEEAVAGRPGFDEFRGDALDEVGGDGEPEPDAAARGRAGPGDGDVDADESALRVEEGAARVPGVDGGVGLDDGQVDEGAGAGLLVAAGAVELPEVEGALGHVLRLVLVGRGGGGHGDAAVECADDPVGDGVGESEGCPDGDGEVADVELAGVGEFDGVEGGVGFDFDDGEVAEGVGPDEFAVEEATVAGADPDGG